MDEIYFFFVERVRAIITLECTVLHAMKGLVSFEKKIVNEK